MCKHKNYELLDDYCYSENNIVLLSCGNQLEKENPELNLKTYFE